MSEAPLEERLAAVERALTDGNGSTPDLTAPDGDLVDRVAALEEDVAELEAAVQAVRGYVGSVKHVNDEVEQRADAAMAKAVALERALANDQTDTGTDGTETTIAGRPRCADEQRGGSSGPDAPREHSGPRSPESTADGATDPDDRRSRDPGGRQATDQDRRRATNRDGRRATDSGDRLADPPRARQTGDRCDDPDTAAPAGPGPGEGGRSDGGNENVRVTSRTGDTHATTRDPGDAHAANEDRDGDRRQPREPGRGRVGHRRLEKTEEAKGLFARLREVL